MNRSFEVGLGEARERGVSEVLCRVVDWDRERVRRRDTALARVGRRLSFPFSRKGLERIPSSVWLRGRD